MATREYIGFALDGNRIYAARLGKAGGALELLSVKTLVLPQTIHQGTASQPEETKEDSEEDIFNLEGQPDKPEPSYSEESETDEDEEGLDLSGSVFETAEEESNDQVVSEFFHHLGRRRVYVGLNIPQGRSVFQPLSDVQPARMKKREREEFFTSKLAPIYNEVVTTEQYTWDVGENGEGWLVSYDQDTSLLNLVELAGTSYRGKMLISEMLPDEAIWTGLMRSHYELADDETTGLISIGEKTSRIVFLKGREIVQVMPLIGEGAKNRNILQTLFSKVLFEIDKGTVTSLERLVIVHSSGMGEQARDFFRDKFRDTEVELFEPDPEKLLLPEELAGDPDALNSYLTAIGAAQAAAGVDTGEWPSFSLLPEYVRERQRVFKLEWHGMLLLAMIAATPFLINHWYQDYSAQQESLERQVALSEARISELQPIASEVNHLMEQQLVLQEMNERITGLSEQTLLWSETIKQLNEGMGDIRNTWITSLQTAGNDLNLQGYSLYRHRIPLVSEIFDDAHVFQVTEGTIRGATVYHFTIRVNNFRSDEERFNPDIPEFNFEDVSGFREMP
ncbi:hypothetical protein QA596_12105 [Balneolales bacterium ANBcel1]|nr:hypothetical protein [Balneolales bacterium ANBcel1]